MDALEALKTRRSVRSYTMRPIEREILSDLVDCARLAPSQLNRQNREFIAITEREVLQTLAKTGSTCTYLSEAAAAVAVVMTEEPHSLADAACAATCLMVAARAYELGSCWLEVIDTAHEEAVAEILGVGEPARIVCLLSLGYGKNPPPPPKDTLEDVLHWERFS